MQILRGFDAIWYAGDDTWANSGSDTLTAVNDDSGVSGGASNSTTLAIAFDFSNNVLKVDFKKFQWNYGRDQIQ